MKNLKFIRQQASLTQSDVAKALEIPTTTYANYEQSRTFPSPTLLIQLADFFNCSIDYLLGHQTKSTLQLEGFTEAQRKIIELVSKLTPEQSWFVLGKISDVLELPYDSVKPVRPF